MALTAHQEIKMQELIELIKAGHKRITLTAKAGCGKTFMMSELIKILKTSLYEYGAVYVTAPTHKALSVLKTKIEEKPYIHFKTIHSAHQLTQKINFKTGQKFFSQLEENPRNPRFRAAQIVIVDESTMLEEVMIEYNDQHPNLLFIFIGDPSNDQEGHPGQLPPVNEKRSPVFSIGYPEVRLTEIVRQGAGSPIIELSNNLNLIRSKKDVVNEIGGYVFENDRNYITDKLAAVNGTDEIKYVSWTNADVDAINKDVRIKVYGNPKKIELGESLIFTAPYLNFKNNQEIKVNEVEIIDTVLKVPTEVTKFAIDAVTKQFMIQEQFVNGVRIDSYETYPIKLYQVNENIYILHEEYDKLFISEANKLKTKCKNAAIIWPAYYWFVEKYAQFTYNHALTVHKSQGSTFTTTVVNVSNIEMNRRKNPEETDSMLYTAITRASKMVVLYNAR